MDSPTGSLPLCSTRSRPTLPLGLQIIVVQYEVEEEASPAPGSPSPTPASQDSPAPSPMPVDDAPASGNQVCVGVGRRGERAGCSCTLLLHTPTALPSLHPNQQTTVTVPALTFTTRATTYSPANFTGAVQQQFIAAIKAAVTSGA